MKQIILSLLTLCSLYAAKAESCVSVQQLSSNYADKTVTFRLTWQSCANSHQSAIWCFVDFREADVAGNKGAWARATINGTPAITNGSAYLHGNTTGFWVTGNNGNTATITVQLDNAPAMFDWCAFASSCPATADALDYTTITCSGTALDVKMCDAGTSVWSPNNLCPSGWRWPSVAELKCMYANRASINIREGFYWSNQTNEYTYDCFAPSLPRATCVIFVNVPCACNYFTGTCLAGNSVAILKSIAYNVRCVRR